MKNKPERCEGKLTTLQDLDTEKITKKKKFTTYHPPFRPGTEPKTKRTQNYNTNN
jgi:hypothetical protein